MEATPMDWFKLNTEGTFKASSGMTFAGGIIRDENGNWLVGFAFHIGPSSSLQTELWGILQRPILCWEKGLNCITVEVDNQCVVDIIQRKEKIINVHYRLIRNINKILNRK